jgi:hypothetical protein
MLQHYYHGFRGFDDYNRAEMIDLSHANEFPDLM